jgi:D-threo-aldose 1-dehydrogenase
MRHNDKVELVNGVTTSRIGIGAAPLGGLFTSVSESDGVSVVETALSMGINYFDTAPHYGKGASEARLGKYLGAHSRDEYVLSTKVGRLLKPVSSEPDPDFLDADNSVERVFDFSGDGVERSLKDSLERMGKGFVEIVFIHDPDDHADWAITEAFPRLAKLRDEGVIKAIGVGMNQTAIPTRFINETDIDIVLMAGRYTLLDQTGLQELLPAALKKDVSVLAAGVLNSGILANPVAGATYDYMPASSLIIAKAQAIKSFFEEQEINLQQAALQFPFRHPAVKAILVGCRTESEVRSNVTNFDQMVPEKVWDDFDRFLAEYKVKQ